jgi:hypothetical protein
MDFGWAPRSHEILDLDGGGVSAVTCSLIPAWRGVISHCSRSQGRQQEPEVTTPPKPVPAASVGTVLSQAGAQPMNSGGVLSRIQAPPL